MLAAEDDEVRDDLARALCKDGYVVAVRSHGMPLLKCLRHEHPDLLISYACEPGAEGMEVIECERQDGELPAMIVVTALCADNVCVRGRRSNDRVFDRAFDVEDLLADVPRLMSVR